MSAPAMFRRHWPEYAIEACALGFFMFSACAFTVLLEHPASPVRQAIASALVRRALTGAAMAATLITIVYSRWGKRSGAHINPSVTLTFFRLGRVAPADAGWYALSQFAGAIAGVILARVALGSVLAHPDVSFAATRPGPTGVAAAFVAESVMAFGMMIVVLVVSNSRLERWTGVAAATLVFTYITFEAPLSGMSMNPARSLGSALPTAMLADQWLYFVAPPLGMLLASEVFVRVRGAASVRCAKLHHVNAERCIFCEFRSVSEPATKG